MFLRENKRYFREMQTAITKYSPQQGIRTVPKPEEPWRQAEEYIKCGGRCEKLVVGVVQFEYNQTNSDGSDAKNVRVGGDSSDLRDVIDVRNAVKVKDALDAKNIRGERGYMDTEEARNARNVMNGRIGMDVKDANELSDGDAKDAKSFRGVGPGGNESASRAGGS